MLKQKTLSKRGFTIIEVVLVLAIAGLIFLMVFLALPALQRSQRDTQRRNTLGEFRTQITQYQANNNGRLPRATTSQDLTGAWGNFLENYLDLGYVKKNTDYVDGSTDGYYILDENAEDAGITEIPFIDPDGEPIFIASACDMVDGDSSSGGGSSCNGSAPLTWNGDKHKIYVYVQATCDGEEAVPVKTSGTRSVAFRYKLEGAGIYCGTN